MPVSLVRKPVELLGWNLVDQADMLDALTALSADGWRGAIFFDPASSVLRMELNADNPTRQVFAAAGDWLVSDMGLRKLSGAEFADNYEVED